MKTNQKYDPLLLLVTRWFKQFKSIEKKHVIVFPPVAMTQKIPSHLLSLYGEKQKLSSSTNVDLLTKANLSAPHYLKNTTYSTSPFCLIFPIF